MINLSAVIITYNEIYHIENLIKDVSFANEVIIVDSYSTDGTYEKLLSYNNLKVYQRHFDNFPNQKNYALSLTKNNWILFLDADERISEDFKKEVIEKINLNKSPIIAYYSTFNYYIDKKRIRFSGMQSTLSYRLFKKSNCEYDSNFHVHEKLKVNGESGKLDHSIEHYSYRSMKHFKKKIFFYEELKAKELRNKNIVPGLFHFYIKPTYKFFNNYFIRLGILDNLVGFNICLILAKGVRHRFKTLKNLNNNKINP